MKDMKILLHEWKKYEKILLTEEADPAALDDERFPLKLSQVNTKLARKYTRSGGQDGDLSDDVVQVVSKSFPVTKLKPSQSSMNIGKAMAQAMAMIQGDMDIGGNLEAFISNDGHIMDGHHRWVATSMVDPTKEVGGYLVDFPGAELIAVLNAITKGRLGIQKGKAGKGSFAEFEPGPIKKALVGFLQNGIQGKFPKTPEYVQQALEKFTGVEGGAALDAAVKKFVGNLAKVKPFVVPPGAPPRPEMPVIDPDMVAGATGTAIKALRKGEIDLNPPYAAGGGTQTAADDGTGKRMNWKKAASAGTGGKEISGTEDEREAEIERRKAAALAENLDVDALASKLAETIIRTLKK